MIKSALIRCVSSKMISSRLNIGLTASWFLHRIWLLHFARCKHDQLHYTTHENRIIQGMTQSMYVQCNAIKFIYLTVFILINDYLDRLGEKHVIFYASSRRAASALIRTWSSLWRHVRDRPPVPLHAHAPSPNPRRRKCKWLDIQCLKAPAIVLRHRLFTAFLFSASAAHSCTVRVSRLHVAVCLEEGGCWNVCGKKCYLWCCMQSSYYASKGSKPTSWQDLCLLYCNGDATVYPPPAKHIMF